MGTRSIHIFPTVNDKIKFQYLQFDGYPSHQLKSIIEGIKNCSVFILSEYDKDLCINFLNAFYNFKSLLSHHSVNASDIVEKYDLKEFADSMWCEWAYEWFFDEDKLNLKVTNLCGEVEPMPSEIISFDKLICLANTNKFSKFAEKIQLQLDGSEV